MLRTDSLEHVACLLTVKATACIRAKNIYPVFFGKDVAQFFELNRGLSLALFPQEMHTFPKHRHASLLSTRSFRRRDDQITQELQESSRIRQIITINAGSVSAASKMIYLPCSIAAPMSKPYAFNRRRRASRWASVATTIAASPALRAVPMNCVESFRSNVSSE
jgi:hypothetical protein